MADVLGSTTPTPDNAARATPVAVVTTDGYLAWLGDWLMSEDWMKHSPGDKLYSAATVTALEADVERLRTLLDETRCCFTRDDDLPNYLLPRIDEALDGAGAK